MTHDTGYTELPWARAASNGQLRTPRGSGPARGGTPGRAACGVSGLLLAGIFATLSLGNCGISHAADATTAAEGLETQSQAVAGNPSGAPVSSEPEQASLAEIIVTAQKREERLIDVPQSVSVLSADTLATLGATQFSDFASTVPGLDFTTAGAGFNQISMRGVTTGFDVSPTVGIYVDEVPYGSSTHFANGAQLSLDVALFDLDRIEVLRGPQGTLYGASAMGGILKYVTKRPDTTSFGGNLQAGVSSTGDGGGINYNVASAVNLPLISDKAALRLSGYETHDGGFVDNVARHEKDVNRDNIWGGRLDFLFTPSDALNIRITAFGQDIRRHGDATVDYTYAGAMPYGSLGQYRPYLGGEPFDDQFRLVSGHIAYDFGPLTLTSVSAYQTNNQNNVYDVTTSFAPFCAFQGASCGSVGLVPRNTLHKFTQEVRLASNGSHRIDWQIGGFYNDERSAEYYDFSLYDLAGKTLPNLLLSQSEPSTYREYAAFGNLTLHVTDKLDLSGGIREAHDIQNHSEFGTGILGASDLPDSHSSENVTNYSADARYHFANSLVGYVRYATGYRPGGSNALLRDPGTGLLVGQSIFQPDSLKSYEIGFKGQTEDRRYAIDIDAYDIHWRNIQISIIQGGLPGLINAPGGATVQGSEMTLTARPIDRFIATAAFAYQHAYMNDANAQLGASEGERLPNVPRFTASLNADYHFMEEGWRPMVGATVRYVTDRYTSFDGSTSYLQYHLPKYTSADVRAGFTAGTTDLQLYIHNLFDERAQLGVLAPGFGNRVAIMQPRTIGINANYHF